MNRIYNRFQKLVSLLDTVDFHEFHNFLLHNNCHLSSQVAWALAGLADLVVAADLVAVVDLVVVVDSVAVTGSADLVDNSGSFDIDFHLQQFLRVSRHLFPKS